MGLIGNGGVHASEMHLQALITWAKKEKIWDKTFIHAFLDGRDVGKDTGVIFLKELIKIAILESVQGNIKSKFSFNISNRKSFKKQLIVPHLSF